MREVIRDRSQTRAASACFLLAALTSQVAAQPITKNVTIVVPYSAGGGTDTVARLIGEQMSRALGRTVVIENVVGGGSTIANDRVARSAPDGSTVLINHVALLAAPSLFNNLRYDTQTAFEPVGLVNNAPMLLIGRKSIPGSGPKDYVAWIKAAGRQGELRAWRHRHQQPPVRRHDGRCARLQADRRGLSRLGAGDHRSPRRAGRSPVGPGHQRDHAGPVRRAARHRRHLAAAARAVEGRADHGRARHARGQLHDVARALRGEGHAEGNGRRAQRGAAQGRLRSGRGGEAEGPRHRAVPGGRDDAGRRMRSLFASDLPRVAKLVESSGIKASEAK